VVALVASRKIQGAPSPTSDDNIWGQKLKRGKRKRGKCEGKRSKTKDKGGIAGNTKINAKKAENGA
jgi:hypothetical protein